MRNHNILSVGVDIENINRFKKINNKLLSSIFTNQEIIYCKSKKQQAQHFAARFAAKEAVRKAYGSIGKHMPSFMHIDICKRKNGAPYIKLLKKKDNYNIHISMSHADTYAIAYAFISL